MKFGQLIKSNMRISFLKKSYSKSDGKTSPTPLKNTPKKSKLSISLNQQFEILYNLVLFLCPSRGLSKYIGTNGTNHLLLPHIKFFQKWRRGLELVSLPHFPDDFRRKIYLALYSITWSNFVVWLPLLLEILDNICIVIICLSVYDIINFEINFNFLIKPFSTWPKKLYIFIFYIYISKIHIS